MRRRHVLAFLLVLAACLGCDQASKHAAEAWLAGSAGLSLVGGAVRLELAFNPGGFLSLGAGLPDALRHLLFVGLVPLGVAVVCWSFLARRSASRPQVVALALIAGGGLGNWLDRLLQGGAVTDFVSLGLGGLRTGIFNLADLAVVAGIAVLLLGEIGRAAPPKPAA